MIVEAFVSVMGTGIVWLLSFIPTSTVDIPSFGPIVGLLKVFDGILPVNEAFIVLSAYLAVRASVFVVDMWLFIYKLIPFKAT